MKKREMIKSKKVFTTLIKTGKFIKTKDYVIYYKENNLEKIRFGIAISNKIGNAVIRNKLKRQTREIIKNLKFIRTIEILRVSLYEINLKLLTYLL